MDVVPDKPRPGCLEKAGAVSAPVFRYPWQRAGTLEWHSDTDWAGCPKTRKSTGGVCLMLGAHLLKSWSSTQPSISLSSGEAE